MANSDDDLPEGFEIQEDALPEGFEVSDHKGYEIKNKPIYSVGNARFGEPAFQVGGATPKEVEAAKRGVDVDSGYPGISNFKGGFAANKLAYYKKILEKNNIPTRDGPAGLEFQKPDGNWGLVENEAQKSLVGPSLSATGSLIGGAAGALATKSPTVAGAGAAAGHMIGEMGRLGIGEAMGVNTPEEVQAAKKGVFQRGVWEGIMTAGMGEAPKVGQLAKWMFKGSAPLNSSVASQVMRDSEDYLGILDRINAAQPEGGPKFQPSIAEIASLKGKDKSQGTAIALSRQKGLTQTPVQEIKDQMTARDSDSVSALENAWNKLVVDPQGDAMTAWDSGAAVQNMIQKAKDGVIAPAEQQALKDLEAAQAQAQQMNRQLSAGESGRIVRDSLSRQYNAMKAARDANYDDYRKLAKYSDDGVTSGYRVPVTGDLVQLNNTLQSEVKNALLPNKEGAINNPFLMELQDNLSPILDASGAPHVRATADTMDLAGLDRTIKILSAEDFEARAGEVGLRLQDSARKRLLNGLKDARDSFMDDMAAGGHPELGASLQKANASHVDLVNTFKRELVGEILASDGQGGYKLSAPQVVLGFLENKDEVAAQQLAGLLKQDPNARQEFLKFTQAFYAQNAMKLDKEGVWQLDVKGHEMFMQKYEQVLKPFFTPDEFSEFTKLGGLPRVVMRDAAKVKTLNQVFNATAAAKMARMAPENLIYSFFTQGVKASQLEPTLGLLNDVGGQDVIKGWRAGVVGQLNKQIREDGVEQGSIDPTKLLRIMRSPGMKEKFDLLFGKDFTQNVQDVVDGAKMITATRRSSVDAIGAPSVRNWFSDITKGYIRPMSVEGNIRTGLQGFRQRAYYSRLQDALYDPDAMRALANKARTMSNSKQNVALGAVGVQSSKDLKEQDSY